MFSDNKRALACWSYERNNDLDPLKLKKGSSKNIWLSCDKCGHFFQKIVYNLKKSWCPFCSGRKLCGNHDCLKCKERSFASHDRVIFLLTHHREIDPFTVSIRSRKMLRFWCDGCGHIFDACPDMMAQRNSWCPYCCIPTQKLCNDEQCSHCKGRSFASHSKALQWSDKNELTARQVPKGSKKDFWFECDICGHSFLARPNNVSWDHWCPYCSLPPQKMCEKRDVEDCRACRNHSFAIHPLSKFWSEENDKSPRDYFLNSTQKAKFFCEKSHEFEMKLYSVNYGAWCPNCRFKGEQRLFEFLAQHYSLKREKSFTWCRSATSKKALCFDFEILNGYNTLIELDGGQHFVQVGNWTSPEITRERDKFKMDKANENGYTVIRITWYVVYNNIKGWSDILLDAIEETKPCSRIFICSKGEYDVFDE